MKLRKVVINRKVWGARKRIPLITLLPCKPPIDRAKLPLKSDRKQESMSAVHR